jgi:hypothetical protein
MFQPLSAASVFRGLDIPEENASRFASDERETGDMCCWSVEVGSCVDTGFTSVEGGSNR